MPSIRDFSGGVVNQELQNRDNGAGVLFDCKNVISSWNGELRKRTGTRILKYLDSNSKLIPYRLPNGDDLIMVLNNNKIKTYTYDNEENLIPYVGSTISQNNIFPAWSGNTNINGDWIISDNLSQAEAYQILTANPDLVWSPETTGVIPPIQRQDDNTIFYNGGESFIIQNNTTPFVLHSCSLTWRTLGFLRPDSTVYKRYGTDVIFQYSDDGVNWVSVGVKMSNIQQYSHTEKIVMGDPPRLSYYYWPAYNYSCNVVNDIELVPHRYWRVVTKSIYIDSNLPSDNTVQGAFYCKNINCWGAGSQTEVVLNNCPYTNDDLDNVRWSQNGEDLTFACKGKQPYQIKIANGVFQDGVFTPQDHAAFYTDNGNPSSVTYYQNRLWFGGFEKVKNKVCGSEFGVFDHFKVPSPIAATSAIDVCGTEVLSIIENMFGANNALYCLSADGVSMIDAKNAVVATNQIEFKLRNREPASDMIPTVKDDIMIYLGRDKRKILITDYDFVVQRFKAHCISDKYLDFLKAGIKELHYVPRVPSLIYGILEDGNFFALLFDADNKIDSLFPFKMTGQVKDIQPIKRGNETKLLMTILLENGRWLLEEKNPRADQEIMDFMSKSEKEEYTKNVITSKTSYLDHSIIRSYDTAITEVSNLPYAVGQNVDVIADGRISRKEVKEHGSSILYSWANSEVNPVGAPTIYLDNAAPTTELTVYDKSYTALNGYSIISFNAALGVLNVNVPTLINFLGFRNLQSIVVASEDEADPQISGTFTRYSAGDTTVTNVLESETEYVDCLAWKKDETIVYTRKDQLLDVDSPCCIATSGTDLFNQGYYVEEVTDTKLYMPLGNTSDVYNTSFVKIGTVSQYADSYIIYDNTRYDRDRFLDTQGVAYFVQAYRKSNNNVSVFSSYVELDEEANNIVIGYPYDSYAVLKFVSPYNMRKFPKEISVNFINSGYLELGNTFESLRPIKGNLIDTVSINNKPILINGNYTMTFDKQTFETPYVIVRSDKPMPFIITGMDYKVDMSNYQGGV